MSAVLTRFEVQLPLFNDGTSEHIAVNTFVQSISSITNVVNYNAYVTHADGTVTQCNIFYGLLTTLQQATALGFLNTLNASLSAPALTTIFSVTSEP